MAKYIKCEAVLELIRPDDPNDERCAVTVATAKRLIRHALTAAPAVDAEVITRCKDCTHSTLPSELTQRYGKPGTLTCHNMHAPSNRRNVGSNDFCSYGEPKEGTC